MGNQASLPNRNTLNSTSSESNTGINALPPSATSPQVQPQQQQQITPSNAQQIIYSSPSNAMPISSLIATELIGYFCPTGLMLISL